MANGLQESIIQCDTKLFIVSFVVFKWYCIFKFCICFQLNLQTIKKIDNDFPKTRKTAVVLFSHPIHSDLYFKIKSNNEAKVHRQIAYVDLVL